MYMRRKARSKGDSTALLEQSGSSDCIYSGEEWRQAAASTDSFEGGKQISIVEHRCLRNIHLLLGSQKQLHTLHLYSARIEDKKWKLRGEKKK